MSRLKKFNKPYADYHKIENQSWPLPPSKLEKALDPGMYVPQVTNDGRFYFEEFLPVTDDLIMLPNSESAKILADIEKFWSTDIRALYNEYSLVYKRGLLMHGKQGTGKTATIYQVADMMIKKGAIILYNCEAGMISHSLNVIHSIEPDKKVVVVLEECDQYINSKGFLSLLDGETSHENVFYIATTNYIDKIPPRIKHRPSRFATLIEVGPPDYEARRAYISSKLKNNEIAINTFTEATKGLLIDEIKDVIISTMIFGNTLQDAIAKVMTYSDASPEDDEDNEDDEYEFEENPN